MGAGNVFTIPPGAPFLTVLARSLCDGRLVKGFAYDRDNPMSLATATIYVPTRRAARVLRSEFVDLIGSGSAILPTITPLGETEDDAGYFDDDFDDGLELLPPIGGTQRLTELARLVLAWRNSLPDYLRNVHDDSPLVAPASPADSIWLARSLAELIDAVETEETGWDGLKTIEDNLGDRAIWWQLTTRLLDVARNFWPARLAELNRSSPALHRNQAIRAEAARIRRDGRRGPVIVAGSTGSIPATAELIAAIAELDLGAVVLPGLDLAMGETEWQLAGAIRDDGGRNTDPASRSHPQYGLHHLLGKLGTLRRDVLSLADEPGPLATRAAAVSAAFLPADASINHGEWRRTTGDAALADAFAGIALIEAANEREEALAIAIALKLGLEESGDRQSQVALVTPDRNLARRVTAELRRFGIEADDSAGAPLLSSAHGSLVQLGLEAILRPGDPVALASLLGHRLVRLGLPASELPPLVNGLELLALRGGNRPADPSGLTQLATDAIAVLKANTFAKAWQQPLLDEARQAALLDLARRIEAAVEPLARMIAGSDGGQPRGQFSLSRWARATGEVLEALCRDERGSLESLWSGEAGDALAGLLGDLIDGEDGLVADGPQWIDVMTALIAGIGVKPKAIGHPRVFIWGTLEARLQSVDLMVLGGLNEGVWPGQTANNPFLSRVMKTEIGLEPPERRIGQSAHDFLMGLGSERLVLTRSLRQSGAPAVASRFVQRLMSVAGKEIEAAMRQRGAAYLGWAGRIDTGERQDFAPRPEPRPDATLQPKRYTFSEAGRLRRDPYAIYARHVLRLDPIEPFNTDPGASDRGLIYHAIVERFLREDRDPRAPNAREILLEIASEVFDEVQLPAHIDAVWRPRFLDTALPWLDFEIERRPEIRHSRVELRAKVVLSTGLILSGRADRIDLRKDGKVDIIDYKTGGTPSMKEARSLLDPQLALEAAAMQVDGFNLGRLETANLVYIRLRPGDGFKAETVNNDTNSRTKPEDRRTAMDLAGNALGELIKLTEALRSGQIGFKSRVAPFRDRDFGGDYDHLARVAEWSAADNGDVAEGGEDG